MNFRQFAMRVTPVFEVLTGCTVKFFDIRRRGQNPYLLWKNNHERDIAVLHYTGQIATTERLPTGTVCTINCRLFALLFNGLRSDE